MHLASKKRCSLRHKTCNKTLIASLRTYMRIHFTHQRNKICMLLNRKKHVLKFPLLLTH